jgi:hypothetical protein
MDDDWEELSTLATKLLKEIKSDDTVFNVGDGVAEGLTPEHQQEIRLLKSQFGSPVETGDIGVWPSGIIYDMVSHKSPEKASLLAKLKRVLGKEIPPGKEIGPLSVGYEGKRYEGGVGALAELERVQDQLESLALRSSRFSVLSTLKVTRVEGEMASSLNSASVGWMLQAFQNQFHIRRTATEMTSRYFMSTTTQRSFQMARDNVETVLTDLYHLVLFWFMSIKAAEQRTVKQKGFIIRKVPVNSIESLKILRADLVVAVGLGLRPPFGDELAPQDCFEKAGELDSSLPMYMNLGRRTGLLETREVYLEIDWPTQDGSSSELVRCEIARAGCYESNPLIYNSGIGTAFKDCMAGSVVDQTKWVTIILSYSDLMTTKVEKKVLENMQQKWKWDGTLFEALTAAQNSTWFVHSRIATLSIKEPGKPFLWKASFNNVIINDVGNGKTFTYGNSNCATIKMYAQVNLDPIVPCVQVCLDDSLTRPKIVHLEPGEDGGKLAIPMLMSPKALCVTSVLFTVLAKAGTLNPLLDQSTHTSTVKLSSSFGLQSPNDICAYIDFMLVEMLTFKPMFDQLRFAEAEELIIDETSILYSASIGFSAGDAFLGLRGTRHECAAYLSEAQNRAFGLAYAWSVVESAIVICWIVTYLGAEIGPVPLPMSRTPPPSEGVEAIAYVLKITLANWLDWSEINSPILSTSSYKTKNLRALAQLMSREGPLIKCLKKCKHVIQQSPDLRPYKEAS